MMAVKRPSSASGVITHERNFQLNKTKVKFSIYALAFILLASNAVSPAMASISAAFPEISASGIQMILSLPMLISAPFILLGGAISNRFPKKRLIIIGLLFFTLGGLGGFFANHYIALLLTRCIFGIGYGILIPCSMGLVADLFFGTEDYEPMIGYENALKSLGSIAFTSLAGVLCAFNWHNVFLLYAVGGIVLVIIVLCLPNIPLQSREASEKKTKKKIPAILIPSILIAFFFSFCMSVNNGHLSYLIENGGFGTSSVTGIVASLATVTGVVGSVLYSRLSKALVDRTLLIGISCNAAGLLCAGFAVNLVMVVIGVLLVGLGLGMANPSLLMLVGRVSKESSTLYFSFIMAAMNIGAMLSGALIPIIAAAVFGGTGLGKFGYLTGGIGQVLCLVAAVFLVRKFSGKHDNSGIAPVVAE